MTKRRLSQQQQRRIRANRERTVAASDDETLGVEQAGLVIARYGKRALIEDDSGQRRQCHLRANFDSLVAGDKVIWAESDGAGVVLARRDRHSVLSRPDPRGNLRPVAANIDLMLIVIAPKPQAHANLIDRYLVAAESEGIDAALILNKADLLADDDPLNNLLASYEALGYPTVRTGINDPDAEALTPVIRGKTLVLVGQSGVGKSSLVQRLLPDIDIRIGALSEAIDKGKHTTTTAELYHLPAGGQLIDSPGIREFHLHHLPAARIIYGFREFLPFIGSCKFRDCQHDHEGDCAILNALAQGAISRERFDSYRQIVAMTDH